jgi:hypothetical protein
MAKLTKNLNLGDSLSKIVSESNGLESDPLKCNETFNATIKISIEVDTKM